MFLHGITYLIVIIPYMFVYHYIIFAFNIENLFKLWPEWQVLKFYLLIAHIQSFMFNSFEVLLLLFLDFLFHSEGAKEIRILSQR